MENQVHYTSTPEERARRRAQRIAARKKRERARRRRLMLRLLPALALLLAAGIFLLRGSGGAEATSGEASGADTARKSPLPEALVEPELPEPQPEPAYSLSPSPSTVTLGEELPSRHAIVIDLAGDQIVAQKDAFTVISPASMTKILTILTAAEHITDEARLDDQVIIDFDITNYCYLNDCSVAGFLRDEAVTVRDLFYGAILPSGGEAAMGLAKYVAGSQEAFVALMNEKAAELGLGDTAHFTNCIGLYDEENVCTVYDMAMILKAAMDNDLCRRVLTAKVYEIPASEAHPEGMVLSNWFLRKIEDHMPEDVEILGAKTGFVNESGNCAASCARSADGGIYLCVTADAFSSWRCIKDHAALYEMFASAGQE